MNTLIKCIIARPDSVFSNDAPSDVGSILYAHLIALSPGANANTPDSILDFLQKTVETANAVAQEYSSDLISQLSKIYDRQVELNAGQNPIMPRSLLDFLSLALKSVTSQKVDATSRKTSRIMRS